MDSFLLFLPRTIHLQTTIKKRGVNWRFLRPVSMDDLVLFLYGTHGGDSLCGFSS